MDKILSWMEAHPVEAGVIGVAGVVVLLYAFGFFGSSSASAGANQGASNLASAYYAAEAQQAVVGGQIQLATVNDAAATAQVQDQQQALVAINAANNTASTAIAGYQLGAVQSTNAANVAENASNNYTANELSLNTQNTTLANTMLSTIVPQELALTGGTAAYDLPSGLGEYFIDPIGAPGAH